MFVGIFLFLAKMFFGYSFLFLLVVVVDIVTHAMGVLGSVPARFCVLRTSLLLLL
jgi:hypothetical protein